jgi:hypothetical protein
MKILLHPPDARPARGGWALLVTLTLTACAAMVMAGVLSWSNTSSWVIARNNEYYATSYAAEAATEKAMSGMIQDYENTGWGYVASRLSIYSNAIPNASDSPYWNNYSFSAGSNQPNLTVINLINQTNIVYLGSPYEGLMMLAAEYEVISTVSNSSSGFNISAAVGQQINLGVVPIFQFAIFYQNTLEINPGSAMTVNGLVHGNTNIFIDPTGALTFSNSVSSSGSIDMYENPLDPTSGRPAVGTATFDGSELSGVSPLNLPVGTNSSGTVSNNVEAILQIPPSGAGPTSATGTNYLYNQADMIILVSNNSVTVQSGPGSQSNPNVAIFTNTTAWTNFLSTNSGTQFYDQRDALTVQAVDLDVGNLAKWAATNTTVLGPQSTNLGRQVDSVFIQDFRTTNSSTQPGIVLTNGTTLPNLGLAVVTPDPVYIKGNYNVGTNWTAGTAPNSVGIPTNLNTANTSQTYPAAIYADAITILSPNWVNSTGTESYTSRTATADTVNAAFLEGIVPSNGSYYSGGVENFPRLLENWNGTVQFTYNGSMVAMFDSVYATGKYLNPGNYYYQPDRVWAFDTNFNNPAKLPPLTPKVVAVNRGAWTFLNPNTTKF